MTRERRVYERMNSKRQPCRVAPRIAPSLTRVEEELDADGALLLGDLGDALVAVPRLEAKARLAVVAAGQGRGLWVNRTYNGYHTVARTSRACPPPTKTLLPPHQCQKFSRPPTRQMPHLAQWNCFLDVSSSNRRHSRQLYSPNDTLHDRHSCAAREAQAQVSGRSRDSSADTQARLGARAGLHVRERPPNRSPAPRAACPRRGRTAASSRGADQSGAAARGPRRHPPSRHCGRSGTRRTSRSTGPGACTGACAGHEAWRSPAARRRERRAMKCEAALRAGAASPVVGAAVELAPIVPRVLEDAAARGPPVRRTRRVRCGVPSCFIRRRVVPRVADVRSAHPRQVARGPRHDAARLRLGRAVRVGARGVAAKRARRIRPRRAHPRTRECLVQFVLVPGSERDVPFRLHPRGGGQRLCPVALGSIRHRTRHSPGTCVEQENGISCAGRRLDPALRRGHQFNDRSVERLPRARRAPRAPQCPFCRACRRLSGNARGWSRAAICRSKCNH